MEIANVDIVSNDDDDDDDNVERKNQCGKKSLTNRIKLMIHQKIKFQSEQ